MQPQCRCGRQQQGSDAITGQPGPCPICGGMTSEPPAPGWSRGLIIGVALGGALLCATLVWAIWWGVGEVKSAAGRIQESNNFRQIGIAFHNITSTYGALPQAATFRDKNGKPTLSWRVAVIPYLESDTLYSKFKFDEPWDSPHNIKLLPMIPKVFQRPNQPANPDGLTHYLAVVGKGSVFDEGHPTVRRRGRIPPRQFGLGLNVPDITDGMSTTIGVVAAAKPVP